MAKWQSKRFSNPLFLPSLSVVLFCLLPNHPFSNLDFSGLGQPFFLNFDFAVSKWPKFNNWPTFSRNINDLIHFRPHQTLCYFSGLLSVPASTRWPLHFGLSLCNLLEQIMLPYLIWKGIAIPSIWGILAWSATRGYRVIGCLYVYQNRPSYILISHPAHELPIGV